MTTDDRFVDDDGVMLIPVWAAAPLRTPGPGAPTRKVNAPGREQRCPEVIGGCGRIVTVASTGYINAHSTGRIKQSSTVHGTNLRRDNQCPLAGELWRDVATRAVEARRAAQ